MKIWFILAALLILSCKDTYNYDDASLYDTKPERAEGINAPRVALQGEAATIARTWQEWRELTDALSVYDRSPKSTERIKELLNVLPASLPQTLDEQPVRSRITLVQTRFGIYNAYAKRKQLDQGVALKYYNDFVIAMDELTTQLNEKPQFQDIENTLIDQLGDALTEDEKREREELKRIEELRQLEQPNPDQQDQ